MTIASALATNYETSNYGNSGSSSYSNSGSSSGTNSNSQGYSSSLNTNWGYPGNGSPGYELPPSYGGPGGSGYAGALTEAPESGGAATEAPTTAAEVAATTAAEVVATTAAEVVTTTAAEDAATTAAEVVATTAAEVAATTAAEVVATTAAEVAATTLAPSLCDGEDIAALDLAILMDGSESISYWEFEHAKEFLIRILSHFYNIGPKATQMAMVQYNGVPYLGFYLSTFDDQADILSTVRRMRYLSGITLTAKAIKKVVRGIFKESRVSEFGVIFGHVP